MITVAGLCRYPVKSLASMPVSRMGFSSQGPVWDRRWMLVDPQGRFLSQRQLPRMCRLLAEGDASASQLAISDMDSGQRFELDTGQLDVAQRLDISVWSDRFAAVDAGDAAADWLSARLGRRLRLCYFPENYLRQVDRNYAQPGDAVGFADGFPVLLCNLESLRVIQADLQSAGSDVALSIWRFRPNIVVDGAAAFAERQWRRLRIGELEFDLVKPCARCVIPTIDPSNGERQPPVFGALQKYCRGEDGQVYFGQNALLRASGGVVDGFSLAEGMSVEILA